MANIHVKASVPRIDHPKRHPDYKKFEKRSPQLWSKMQKTFENEAQKQDYLKAVSKNENNIVGMPAFYPPTEIKTAMFYEKADEVEIPEAPCGHGWVSIRIDQNTNRCVYRCKYGHEAFQSSH